MQAVGLEPTRANTLRPERSTLDHSVTLASEIRKKHIYLNNKIYKLNKTLYSFLIMNSDLQFENLIHEARMQSIRGQHTESLKT